MERCDQAHVTQEAVRIDMQERDSMGGQHGIEGKEGGFGEIGGYKEGERGECMGVVGEDSRRVLNQKVARDVPIQLLQVFCYLLRPRPSNARLCTPLVGAPKTIGKSQLLPVAGIPR